MRTRVTAVLSTLLLAIVLAAGCSDGDGDDSDDSSRREDETESATTGDDGDDADASDGEEDGDDPSTSDGDDSDVPAGSDPEVRQEYIDAIVASAETDEQTAFDVQAAECLATAFVDAAGTDALTAAGVTPQQLAEAEESPADLGVEFPEGAGDAFYEQVSGCMDLREMILGNFAGEADSAMAECISDALTDDMLKEFFVGTIIEGLDDSDPEFAALQQRMDEAVEPCLATG